MEKITLVLISLSLTACSMFSLSKFDGHEYARMVDARHELRGSACANDREAQAMINIVQQDIEWLRIYSQHLPDNDNTIRMLAELAKTSQEMLDRYDSGQPVSPIYCRLKVKNLQDQMDIMLKTTARRQR